MYLEIVILCIYNYLILCARLDSAFSAKSRAAFSLFFFLTSHAFQGTTSTIAALFITVHALKNIKNRSHDTIHTFKNYFATVLSVVSFSNNNFNLNGPYIDAYLVFFFFFIL